MSKNDELLKVIDYGSEYPVGKAVGNNERLIKCPFHNDKVASLSVNLTTGVYKCHACDAAGNFITWAQHENIDLNEISIKYGIKPKQKRKPKNIIDEKIILDAHKVLLENEPALNYLLDIRGINKKTVKKFKIGMINGRLSIPIYDQDDQLRNIRLYKTKPDKNEPKIMSYGAGFGEARLFPISNINNDEIILCEGEPDALKANSEGFNAITTTAGANTWKQEWNYLFQNKKVVICYDIDEAGKQGAQKITKELQEVAEEIKIINLPLDPNDHPKGDLTDFFLSGNNATDFRKLIDSTEIWAPPEAIKRDVFEIELAEASQAKFNSQFIIFTAIVTGKDTQPYIVPKNINFECGMINSKLCRTCPLFNNNGAKNYELDVLDPDFLMLLDSNNIDNDKIIKTLANIPPTCKSVKSEVKESYNVERIVLAPEIEYTSNINDDAQYVTRVAFYLGHSLEANRVYTFKGITLNHPKNQQATHLLLKAEPALTAVESFIFTNDKKKNLEIFQDEDIQDKFKEMYENTIIPVTGIIGRLDLFITIFLSYLSVIKFRFDNRIIQKGWIETLILGDTRTGKSEMSKSLIEYFRIGELILGESASFAGLVGGLQQIGSRWNLNWGRIPLNNKRLVFIDEMSGLSISDIGKFSGIRSSGIAEITKIRTERTWARTRLIWMSNIRGTKFGQRELAAYTQGVRSIPELIGKQEDISRFDIVLLQSGEEVDINEINKPRIQNEEPKFKGDYFHDLIMWVWSLGVDDVVFAEDSERQIFEQSNIFAKKYSPTIPIVVPSEQRIKLARVSIAIAAAMYSNKDGKLIVKEEHVFYASHWMQKIFDKPVCAYDEYSEIEKKRNKMTNKDGIKKMLTIRMVNQFLDLDSFTFRDLQDILGLNIQSEARDAVADLIESQAIKRTHYGYEKTKAFIKFIRQLKKEGVTSEIKVEDENQMENEDEKWWEK